MSGTVNLSADEYEDATAEAYVASGQTTVRGYALTADALAAAKLDDATGHYVVIAAPAEPVDGL